MASDLQIVVTDPRPGQIDDAHQYLEQLESLWSRFIGTSDITRLNDRAGEPVEVAAETLTLLATMVEACEVTGGRFDPGILPLLVVNGYAVSRVDPQRTTVLPATTGWRPGSILEVALDADRSCATLPAGLAVDPGGIGKGLAADLTVARLLARGARGALVSIGGDLAMTGEAPSLDGWTIAVEQADPHDGVLCRLAVSAGGVATSSTRSRRWTLDGTSRHHAIDAVTGRQSTTDLAAVTVIADTGWAAEAHATAALLTGIDGVIDYLAVRGLSGLAIGLSGEIVSTQDIASLQPVSQLVSRLASR